MEASDHHECPVLAVYSDKARLWEIADFDISSFGASLFEKYRACKIADLDLHIFALDQSDWV